MMIDRSPEAAQDRQRQVIQWARQLLESDFVIFDTETTGLGPDAEIVQVGIIDKHGNTLMHEVIRPVGPIPAEASSVHGITDDMVRDAPSFRERYDAIDRLLSGRLVAAYNADFDRRMLHQTCALYNLPSINPDPEQWTCVMKQFARFRGIVNPRYGSYRWHSLTAACHTMNIELRSAHDALADVRMTLDLIRALAHLEIE